MSEKVQSCWLLEINDTQQEPQMPPFPKAAFPDTLRAVASRSWSTFRFFRVVFTLSVPF